MDSVRVVVLRCGDRENVDLPVRVISTKGYFHVRDPTANRADSDVCGIPAKDQNVRKI